RRQCAEAVAVHVGLKDIGTHSISGFVAAMQEALGLLQLTLPVLGSSPKPSTPGSPRIPAHRYPSVRSMASAHELRHLTPRLSVGRA
ncbi:hypothetical protein, partial [Paracraurococcus ruber]|uniref:hypothetical protein n=1 Tax=Paracraurococcus ruber TaxID=77675 RepID=UPI001A9166BC